MLLYSLAIITGFILLVWGADRFVIGAAATARNLGIPPLIIGLTVIGFGTSAPEMLISGLAAAQGNAGLAIGNALGSNIANIALILGVSALVLPLSVDSNTLRREMPLLIGITLLAMLLLWDRDLSRLDGILLFSSLLLVMGWIVRQAISHRNESGDPLADEYETELPHDMAPKIALMWLAIGLIVLLASSKLLIWGAVAVATAFGISDLVIGLTIVAIGTSLPELAASVMSVLKKEYDLAVGNVIGSNIFNTLGVLALPGLIAPGVIPEAAFSRDLMIVFALTIALLVMAYGFRGRPGVINRFEAALLLSSFGAYQWLLFQQMA